MEMGSNKKQPVVEVNLKSNRKTSKPLMEKRRRARINQSLAELKELVVRCGKNELQNYRRRTRLEKADILELTVRHLHRLHKIDDCPNDEEKSPKKTTSEIKFRAGFRQCVHEIENYLGKTNIVNEDQLRPSSILASPSVSSNVTTNPTNKIITLDQSSKAQLFRYLSGRLSELSTDDLLMFQQPSISTMMATNVDVNSISKPESLKQIEINQNKCGDKLVNHSLWRPW